MMSEAQLIERGWERRAHSRMPVAAWVMFETAYQARIALTVDVSFGGLSARRVPGARIGQVVDLWVLLPNAKDIECEAEIVNQDRSRLGFRFLGISELAVERLNDLLYPEEPSRVRAVLEGRSRE